MTKMTRNQFSTKIELTPGIIERVRTRIDEALQFAEESPRKRYILRYHDEDAGMHVMLNAFLRGTYAQPHKHGDLVETQYMPKLEFFIPLYGKIGLVTFNEQGAIQDTQRIESAHPTPALIPPYTFHIALPLTDRAVTMEFLTGPYQRETHKKFAPWAPAEGTEEARTYLRNLEALFH